MLPSYDQRVHAAIKVKYLGATYEFATIMVFRRGSVIITAHSGPALRDAHRFITEVVENHLESVRLSEDDAAAPGGDDDFESFRERFLD
jgi:hypothetical protein